MAEKFYTLLTEIGKAKIANSAGFGSKINFVKMKVGDGGGSYYNPREDQEDLINTVWEGNITHVAIDEKNPNWINVEMMIPANVGGFMIREYGVFDEDNNMLAIAKCAESYKPLAEDGSTKELIMKMVLTVSNTENIILKIDPTIIFAKKSEIEILENKIKNIKIPVTSVNSKTGAIELKAEDIKTNSGESVELQLDDITTEHNESTEQINTSMEEIEKKITNYNSYASGKDSKGVYTVIEYKNKSGALYMKSTLSNADANGNYRTDTWQFYENGNVINTIKWTLSYDTESNITSKVVA
ncbi:phage tail protein [Clostridium sporogenes]|uniref:phage tail protein n=1 Tax=Clostridium sporogenes TaxID=1509 RepID=UPI001FAE73A0|nr:phage tail protein [Clostridium sporogenes]